MPTDVVVAIADNLVSYLAGVTTYAVRVEPVRSWANWTSEELKGECAEQLRVDVVPLGTGQKLDLEVREKIRHVATFDVAIRQRLGADKTDRHTGDIVTSHVDALVLLTRQIAVSLQKLRLPNLVNAVNLGSELLVNPHRMHLTKWSQFTGVIRTQFRANESLT